VDVWQYTTAGYVVDFSFAVPQWRNERNWTEARPLRRIRLQGAIAEDGGGTRVRQQTFYQLNLVSYSAPSARRRLLCVAYI
jgi:hypothetical protein